jgi:hypothetical protein
MFRVDISLIFYEFSLPASTHFVVNIHHFLAVPWW